MLERGVSRAESVVPCAVRTVSGVARQHITGTTMDDIIYYAFALVSLVAGALLGVFIQRHVTTKRIGEANELAQRIVEEARKEAQAQKKEILLQGQNEIFSQKHAFEVECKDQERALKNREKKLQDISDRMEEKMERITQKEHDILAQEKEQTQRERVLAEKEQQVEATLDEQERRLQEVSGLTAEEAKSRLFEEIESRTRHEAAKMMRVIETEARETADRKAKEILACAIQRYAGDYVGEQTVTAVTLPSEDMKGRIIGREGRNIRALEAATGVDLIIDDTPETVILSAYSPIRRQVARMALERLIQDGRIHPARIEDIVHKCEQELEVQIREVGEQATFDAGVHGINPDIIRLLGQLKYRTSFTQNVLQHSLEVSALCGMMAAELGMDIKRAKRAGLLHDIGKAVDHEVEGSHALIGADIAKKFYYQGFEVYATKGTAHAIEAADPNIDVVELNKIYESEGFNAADLIESGRVDYIISTSKKGRDPQRDSVIFRRKAVTLGIPTMTAIDTAGALIDSITSNYNQHNTELVDFKNM